MFQTTNQNIYIYTRLHVCVEWFIYMPIVRHNEYCVKKTSWTKIHNNIYTYTYTHTYIYIHIYVYILYTWECLDQSPWPASWPQQLITVSPAIAPLSHSICSWLSLRLGYPTKIQLQIIVYATYAYICPHQNGWTDYEFSLASPITQSSLAKATEWVQKWRSRRSHRSTCIAETRWNFEHEVGTANIGDAT